MKAQADEVLHGAGWVSDFYLCGQAPEAPDTERERDDIPHGREARPGEQVGCPACVQLIDHVRIRFTNAHRVRG